MAYFFQERVRFHNTGPSSVPGVIVMSIEDGHEGVPGLSQLDSKWVDEILLFILLFVYGVLITKLSPFILHSYSYIVVIFNSCPTTISFGSPALQGRNLQLHPVQVAIFSQVKIYGWPGNWFGTVWHKIKWFELIGSL